jgi:hypothetical protein
MGLRIVSWRYPPKDSLEKMIENKGLYPVTVLTSVKRNILDTLFRNQFILAKDIAGIDQQTFSARSGLDPDFARILKQQADELCLLQQP